MFLSLRCSLGYREFPLDASWPIIIPIDLIDGCTVAFGINALHLGLLGHLFDLLRLFVWQLRLDVDPPSIVRDAVGLLWHETKVFDELEGWVVDMKMMLEWGDFGVREKRSEQG